MRLIPPLILSLTLSTFLFSAPAQEEQKQTPPSAEEVYEEEDTGEVDEDVIIQDEEGTDEDEGVHN